VDYDALVPVYRQVIDILNARIASGEYAPGQRLPSAKSLQQEFGIAELTGRKVLQVMVEEGIAVMVPGKGTYVKPAEGTSGAHDGG
jgi:DNA-binding GntR family transcriptional regulator